MNRKPLIVKIGAALFTFSMMATFVAFEAGAFKSFYKKTSFGEPDSTKRDTSFTDAGIILTDSTFVVPMWVYSSKAMVSHYELEFDSVFVDTIKYGSDKADFIIDRYFASRKKNPGLKLDKKYMGSSKYLAPSSFEFPDSSDEKTPESPNKKY